MSVQVSESGGGREGVGASEPEHASNGGTEPSVAASATHHRRGPWGSTPVRTVAVTGGEWRERNGSNFYRSRTHHEKVDNCGPSEADVRDGDGDDDDAPP